MRPVSCYLLFNKLELRVELKCPVVQWIYSLYQLYRIPLGKAILVMDEILKKF